MKYATKEDIEEARQACLKTENLKVMVERRPKLSNGGWTVNIKDTLTNKQLFTVGSNNIPIGETLMQTVLDTNAKCEEMIRADKESRTSIPEHTEDWKVKREKKKQEHDTEGKKGAKRKTRSAVDKSDQAVPKKRKRRSVKGPG